MKFTEDDAQKARDAGLSDLANRLDWLVECYRPSTHVPSVPYGRFGDANRITDAELAELDKEFAADPLVTALHNPVIIRCIIATLRAERNGHFDKPEAG